jgi:hypothetical protein
MPRIGGRFDSKAVELISRAACTTPSEAAKEIGANVYTMQMTLERLVFLGMLKKYLIADLFAVYCAPSATPGDAVRAVLRSLGVREELLLKKIREAIAEARGRRICISRMNPVNTPVVNTAVFVYIASLLGGAIHKTHKHVYVCVDVEEAKRRLEAGELHPPDSVVRLAKSRYRARPRREREKMALVSFHLPIEWLRAMDGLIKEGRYANRAVIVREAISQMLERLRRGP